MSDTVNVKGLSDLQRFLDQLAPKLERNVMRGGMRAGANVILPVAKGAIRRRDGVLADSLKVRTAARGGQVTARIYTRVFYARFVEYGTRPHWITSRKDGALSIGGVVFVKAVNHPGAKPYPYLRPALDTQATQAVVAAGNYIKDRLATKHGLDTADITIEAED